MGRDVAVLLAGLRTLGREPVDVGVTVVVWDELSKHKRTHLLQLLRGLLAQVPRLLVLLLLTLVPAFQVLDAFDTLLDEGLDVLVLPFLDLSLVK